MQPPIALSILRATWPGTPIQLADALELRAFRPCLPTQGVAVGWVLVDDPDAVDFADLGRWSLAPYACLGWRTDTKVVQAAGLKLRAAAAARLEGLTGGRARVRAKELVELYTQEELARVTPKPSIVPVLWDTHAGWVYVGTAREADVEAVHRALCAAGAAVERVGPADWSGHELDHVWAALVGEDPSDDAVGNLGYGVAPAFLRWCWWKSESATGEAPSVDLGNGRRARWTVRDGLKLAREGGGGEITVRAIDAFADGAVLAAIVDGRGVVSMGLDLDDQDGMDIARLVVTVDGGGLKLTSLKLAHAVAGGVEQAAATIALLDGVRAALGAMLRRYGAAEGAPSNRSQADAALLRWLSEAVAEWGSAAVAAGRLLGAP